MCGPKVEGGIFKEVVCYTCLNNVTVYSKTPAGRMREQVAGSFKHFLSEHFQMCKFVTFLGFTSFWIVDLMK